MSPCVIKICLFVCLCAQPMAYFGFFAAKPLLRLLPIHRSSEIKVLLAYDEDTEEEEEADKETVAKKED